MCIAKLCQFFCQITASTYTQSTIIKNFFPSNRFVENRLHKSLLFRKTTRTSLKNLNMTSANGSNPLPIRMHCSNCASYIETRVETVTRWFGPVACIWNKFMVYIGLLHFYFGSNQENWSLILRYVALFGMKGSINIHTCPNCNYKL